MRTAIQAGIFVVASVLLCLPVFRGRPEPVSAAAVAQVGGSGGVCPKCGTERWDVKTLSDPAANQVNFTPQTATVKQLYSMPAPASNTARNPSETHTYTVHAKLVGYKIEFDAQNNTGDHDFHIVIQDMNDATKTMVVEIPDPQCEGVCTSLKKDAIAQTRAKFSSGVTQQPESAFFALKNPVEVDVTGVLFFDFAHGQTGLAENCVELHPVIDFKFSAKPTGVANKSNEPKSHPKTFYKCLPEN